MNSAMRVQQIGPGGGGGMDPTAGIAAGAGAVGAGVMNYYGQKAANETNMQIAQMNNAWNAEQAGINREWQRMMAGHQMDFQQNMSSTAHQREVADLKAAGLNPILAAGGGGASSPSGASGGGAQASAQPVRVENTMAGLADGLMKALPTALSVANLAKDLQAKDGQIAATVASANASNASADEKRASAESIRKGLPSVEASSRSAGARADADIASSHTRKAKEEFDRSAVFYDGIMSRIFDLIGGVGSAMNVHRLFENSKSMQQRNHEYLERQGSKGARIK